MPPYFKFCRLILILKLFIPFRFIQSIEDNRRSELRRAKQRQKAKVREAMIKRLQKHKALNAHKTLIEVSNQKILSRIEQLKTQRQKAAQFRTKQAIQQQLSKVRAKFSTNLTFENPLKNSISYLVKAGFLRKPT